MIADEQLPVARSGRIPGTEVASFPGVLASKPVPDPVPAPLQVLLVDDDPATRDLLATMLVRRGHRVTCAEEREEAAALLVHRDYDVVCLDLDLEGLDGLEGLELIDEARTRQPRLRILVETGNGNPRVHAACHQRGASGVFLKGSPLGELERLIEGRQGGSR
jgi:CheY-like chemotaxis protein